MMEEGDYVVDIEELEAVTADLEKCERAMEELTNDIERQMKALQSSWEGLSAQAQREAQDEWSEGLADMRAALADMRQAARVASGNYRLMITTNTSLWRGLL